MQPIRKAVIPAAGFGVRFLPETKAMPKEMLPIVDKPVIQYIVEEVIRCGIEKILIISGHAKRAIEDYFDASPELERHLYEHQKIPQLKEVRKISNVELHYVCQKHIRGTGDAVLCAKDFIDDEPFCVILGNHIIDTQKHPPVLSQMMNEYKKIACSVIGCQKIEPNEIRSRKVIHGERKSNGLIQVQAIDSNAGKNQVYLGIMGRYILTPDIFNVLEKMENEKSLREIRLTEALNRMARTKKVYACEFQGKAYDIGDKLSYLKANVEYALQRENIGDSFKAYLESLEL